MVAQKLKELIDEKSVPLGLTQTGRDWCIKALHPSDPITEVRGIPDESSCPSLLMNYQVVHTVAPTEGATGTWELDGQLLPNPLSFGCAIVNDSLGEQLVEFRNTQILPSADHQHSLIEFLRTFNRWRLAYASVTIYQDGPTLSDQGTVVACQKPVELRQMNVMGLNRNGPNPGLGLYAALHHAVVMGSNDYPVYSNTQAMPNAYFGRSKEGLYMPLKLTRTHQKWRSARDLIYLSGGTLRDLLYPDGEMLFIPHEAMPEVPGIYPFPSVQPLHSFLNGEDVILAGGLTSDFCNENWGDFCFRNMSVSTSLSFYFRFGFEMQVQPASPLAPHLKISPESDPAAIEAYFRVSRELKDAYPADYNDLGKIWSVISSIAKTVGPMLGVVPGVGTALGAAVTGVANIGDRIRDAVSRTKGKTLGNTASASDKELARQAVQVPIRKSVSKAVNRAIRARSR